MTGFIGFCQDKIQGHFKDKTSEFKDFFNLLTGKLNVLINIMFASVVDKCGYLFRFIQKCVNLGSSQRSCVPGRNLSIINKGNLGKYE